MRRYHVQRAVRAAKLSPFEDHSLLAAVLLIVAGIVAAVAGGDAGGLARVLGSLGLAAAVVCAASRGARLYRAGVTASLPTSVARVAVRVRPRAVFSAVTVALSLGLPLAAGVAVMSRIEWGWLVVAGVALLGCAGTFVTWVEENRLRYEHPGSSSPIASELLQRRCMRADMPVPGLVVMPGASATAWTAGARIHLTKRLLALLDDLELEAVLAHELAHLAHRDAAVMEICSAPSRVLLTFAGSMARRLARWLRNELMWFVPGGNWLMFATATVTTFCVPPAFVIGWTARLSVLGSSRAREFSADAAAVALTGRPSALASALMKLDRQREWTPRADLRQVEAFAVLCIVGAEPSRLGRLFSTHPPTAARVKRLRALEARIQGRGRS